jgi:predicted ATPase/DNA-binding SARP family transcriptional activator
VSVAPAVLPASDAPPAASRPDVPPHTPHAQPGAPHNVPFALSAFIGREGDLDEVGRLLERARLVTLAGAGGVGKTRLAREVAARAAGGEPGVVESPRAGTSAFPDGVWWAELAPIPAGTAPAAAVAEALGVRYAPGADPADALAAALGGPAGTPRRALLVLDNCEHVVEGCAALAERLLRGCPGLRVLATSREALGVEGEVVWPVPPLSHPPARPAPTDGAPGARAGAAEAFARSLAAYDAVQLFVERARAVQPGFALTARNAPAVAAITARLDGLPLALELAAANVATLGVEPLAARLDDAFAVLTRGRRTALPRHRTLRALLDWSYHLLGPDERALLARLAVFRGGFTLDAAGAVGAAPPPGLPGPDGVVAALGRLVEQSLVDVREDGGEVRYRLLETVRQYGLARLGEDPADARATRARHAEWVAALTAAAAADTWSAARGRTVAWLEREVDEIRAALAWAAGADVGSGAGPAPGTAADPMTAVRIAGALAWFWFSGVPWAEARARTAAALAAADAQGVPDAARSPAEQAALAELLYPIAGLAYFAGEPNAILAAAERALGLWDAVDARRAADPAADGALGVAAVRGRAVMRQIAGLAHVMRGEPDLALADLDAAVAIARDGGARWMEAVMLVRRALACARVGRTDRALADYAAAVPKLRAVGERWFLSHALEGRAVVELARGDLRAAAAHAGESVAVLRDEPDPWFVARALDAVAAVAVAAIGVAPTEGPTPDEARRERARAAARLLGAAAGLRTRCGADVIGPDRERHAATRAGAAAPLGPAAFAEAWAAGERLGPDDAIALAAREAVVLAGAAPPPAGPARAAPARPAGGAPPAAPALQVLAFGPLAVARGGVPLGPGELTPAKARELLLYLVLHPPRTKEQLALDLWPEASEARVRNAFHVTLFHVRRILGQKDAVAFEGGAYALARAVTGAPAGATLDCDVDAVLAAAAAARAADRRAEREAARGPEAVDAVLAAADDPAADPAAGRAGALAAWRAALDRACRGPLGDGVEAGDWLVAHQGRVRAAWGDGMEALARLHARRGAPAAAAATLEALVAADALREGAHRALMACYAAAGEPARALAHYDALARALAREVGAAPARETRALADAIRRAA